jgi:glyoxylase-like metal-dependent hydrolase (beta-lactamase superfamily II)
MPILTIGDMQVQRVEEFCGPSIPADFLLTDIPEDALETHGSWLFPKIIHPETRCLVTSVHSWIVRTRHHNILIDGCYGNDKPRPGLPVGNMMQTDWLDRLAACGLQPKDIDFVMCTHMHADHVGWNTRLIDGRWVPTFPNARYLFSRREYEHWNPQGENATSYGQDNVFNDSVLPCMEAGLVTFVEEGHTVDDQLTIESAIGHTVANTIIRATSAGKTGLFTGDCLHSPLQIIYPNVNSVVCELPEEARATRWRILEEAAEHGHIMLPAHFPPPFVCKVGRDSSGFRYLPFEW